MKPLTIALGMHIQSGAYGGGNQFGATLHEYLQNKNITITTNLEQPDLDLIVLTDTRPWLNTTALTGWPAGWYRQRHPKTKIIFRVNECDEKRAAKVKLLNSLIAQHAQIADHVVYISSWLQELFQQQFPIVKTPSTVVLNGADTTVFNSMGFTPWLGDGPLRLVTHHWSSNYLKGFDVYQHIDELLASGQLPNIEMTYIGNIPTGYTFKAIKVIPALSGHELATALKQQHAYITASQFEPAGMHHIEAALCGLPILYRHSGALPEYCRDYGIGFIGPSDITAAIATMREHYPQLLSKMPQYNLTAERMCEEYYQLFLKVIHQPTSPKPAVAELLKLQALTASLFTKETVASLI